MFSKDFAAQKDLIKHNRNYLMCVKSCNLQHPKKCALYTNESFQKLIKTGNNTYNNKVVFEDVFLAVM